LSNNYSPSFNTVRRSFSFGNFIYFWKTNQKQVLQGKIVSKGKGAYIVYVAVAVRTLVSYSLSMPWLRVLKQF